MHVSGAGSRVESETATRRPARTKMQRAEGMHKTRTHNNEKHAAGLVTIRGPDAYGPNQLRPASDWTNFSFLRPTHAEQSTTCSAASRRASLPT